jgi:hypothetical protein
MWRRRKSVLTMLALVSGGGLLTASLADPATAGALGPETAGPAAARTVAAVGPASTYDCALNVTTGAFTGADGTASAIGWPGNYQGVVTCLGGTFVVQDNLYKDYGFGIYDGAPMTWQDADGYLPAQITTFHTDGAVVAITDFADRVVIGGHAYVAVYSRVAVTNPTNRVVEADPEPSAGLVPLDSAPDAVKPHGTVDHDYVVAADRFGNHYPWPSAQALAGAGGFDQHFTHMQRFWTQQLSGLAQISVPDTAVVDAYRSGFIYTQIARSGNKLNTGVNGYEREYSHDVVGILSNLFTQGYYSDAHTLLLEARDIVNTTPTDYVDGDWTYSLPWAIYLIKTGDLAFVKQNFSTAGPKGANQPSIEEAAHDIAADRTGPGGIMESTDDIDTVGYWTTDDYEALLGLAAYHYLAQRIGDTSEATWATQQYDSLLAATDQTLDATISQYHLNYLPCSILEPNTADRCTNPEDANWTSPLGDWAWDGYLLGAQISGPGASMIDATYDYGFGRLQGVLPPDTAGGFPGDYYSSAYNAAMGTAGLASSDHRDQGILGYEFMIANSQSGPYSWWESSGPPLTSSPWIGRHPGTGQGSSPHGWGMAGANAVLLNSLVAQASDGDLVVGRGVPATWLKGGPPIAVHDFPSTDGRRLSLEISSRGKSVSLSLQGGLPSGRILFQLPSFIDNLAATSTGTIDQATGTVSLPPHTARVTVKLRRSPARQ